MGNIDKDLPPSHQNTKLRNFFETQSQGEDTKRNIFGRPRAEMVRKEPGVGSKETEARSQKKNLDTDCPGAAGRPQPKFEARKTKSETNSSDQKTKTGNML